MCFVELHCTAQHCDALRCTVMHCSIVQGVVADHLVEHRGVVVDIIHADVDVERTSISPFVFYVNGDAIALLVLGIDVDQLREKRNSM